MVTLDRERKKRPVPSLLSTHPVTRQRIRYLEALVQQSGYNRYAYEGVSRHAAIQQTVKAILAEAKKCKKLDRRSERMQCYFLVGNSGRPDEATDADAAPKPSGNSPQPTPNLPSDSDRSDDATPDSDSEVDPQ